MRGAGRLAAGAALGRGLDRGGAARLALGEGAAPACFERGQRGHRLGLVEQIGEHVLGDRRRRAGAAQAVLDHHRAGVARRWRPARRRRTGRGRDISRRRAGRAGAPVIRRTCAVPVLPPISMPGKVEPAPPGGAVAVDHLPHAARAPSRDALRERAAPAARAACGRSAVGLDVAARGDPRRHHRQLERIDDHEALADRRVERVRLGPVRPLDQPRGSSRACAASTRCRASSRNSGRPPAGRTSGRSRAACAIAAMMSIADAAAHGVEIGVAALGDGAVHVDRAVAAEAAEEAVAELDSRRGS